MIRNAISRTAIGLALTFGAVAAVSAPALAQRGGKPAAQESVSPGFAKVAAPFQKAVVDAKAKPAIVAAKGKPAELAAALGAETAQVPGLIAAAATPFDKYTAGGLVLNLGQVAEDNNLLKQGLTLMIDSGKAPNTQQLQFFLGQTNYQMKDYAGAQAALQAAMASGYKENDVEALLAQSYISGGKQAEGAAVLRKAIEAKQAAGTAAPDSWYRVGLSSAYKAKQYDQAGFFSMGLVKAYPSKTSWASAIAVAREAGRYTGQEALDLMRLMQRTDSFSEGRDYVDYVQFADPRRFPGESLKAIEAGVASGKVSPSDPFIVEAKTIATPRVAQDRASLPALERDARAANATPATISAAADTFLSYGDAAKAIELYQIALAKPGGDVARLNTRLGIAQVDKGDYAGAQATFAKVDGPRKPLADLWSVYAAQKAAGK